MIGKQISWFSTILKKSSFIGMTFVFLLVTPCIHNVIAQELVPLESKYRIDKRIDNMGYWKRMAEQGLVPVAAARRVFASSKKSSLLSDAKVATFNSVDIPVTNTNSTQSENSIFVSPSDRFTILNSNNSSLYPYPGYFLGADDFFSFDGGENWEGQFQGTGTSNMGDPSTAISSNGRWFVGYIRSGGGQALSYSTDGGVTWKIRPIAAPPQYAGGLLDKSHLWVDNSNLSPYRGRLYDGWTVIKGPTDGQIQVSRSLDEGMSWQTPVMVSDSILAQSHNQGVNIATGPNGEAYAIWAVYDAFPGDENALGFASSFNGGETWQPAHRIIDSIRGIRLHGVSKLMRVNSFPCMAVDNSNSPWRGKIYVVWANVNQPGVNSGNGIDIYMISSIDRGSTWSEPKKINQDLPSQGKQHYFPWICCDPDNGNLAVIFYDDRNTPPEQVETWVATSTDGGNFWQDFRISDVAFTPYPVAGLPDNYFGDYLAISSKGNQVYPCWTDNRTGAAMTYVSPFRLGPAPGQSYIVYQSNQYNDSAGGNGNGIPEFGETALLDMGFRNLGDQPDSSVHIHLGCNSSFVEITDSTGFIEFIGAGQSAYLSDAFSFSISNTIPNGTQVIFTITATNTLDSSYQSSFSINFFAPDIDISDFIVNDSTGNNSHSLDPSETAFVRIKLLNNTSYIAENTKCFLETNQGFIHLNDTMAEVGDILSGGEREAVFRIQTDSVRAGTLAAFSVRCEYSGFQSERIFNKKIGLIFDDWETGDFNKFSWNHSGEQEWTIDSIFQYQGKYCVRSGRIENKKKTSFSVSCHALTFDSISFYRKVSSESNYDYLNFYIDNAKVGQWSGEVMWERVVFPLLPGNHEFRWEYAKDKDSISGLDAAFIDDIEFPSIQFTTAFAGSDTSIYECEYYPCKGVITYSNSFQWSTAGSGVFVNPSELNTLYMPSKADKEAGMVTLILKAFGPSLSDSATDKVNLTILPQPVANAGPDSGVCAGEEFQISLASAVNQDSIAWSTTGTGRFDNRNSLLPKYFPGASDSMAGSVRLVLSSFSRNSSSCGIAKDTMLLSYYPLPVIPIQQEFVQCAGYPAVLNATTPGGISYLWEPNGDANPEIVVDSAGIGIGKASVTVTVTNNLGCSTVKTVALEFVKCDIQGQAGEVFFRVYPNPVHSVLTTEFFSTTSQVIWYQLINPSGEIMMESPTFEVNGLVIRSLDLTVMAQGAYVLLVMNGELKTSLKVIIL